jgi:hypothetical protein
VVNAGQILADAETKLRQIGRNNPVCGERLSGGTIASSIRTVSARFIQERGSLGALRTKNWSRLWNPDAAQKVLEASVRMQPVKPSANVTMPSER